MDNNKTVLLNNKKHIYGLDSTTDRIPLPQRRDIHDRIPLSPKRDIHDKITLTIDRSLDRSKYLPKRDTSQKIVPSHIDTPQRNSSISVISDKIQELSIIKE